ncbi:MAG: adenylate/guanylate cyclase domain-containing protein [Anaerolineae bacterium]|nr:adenylate/guanylate cyclase domain-containing protein [Anaerolineae bacterium]
MALSTLANVNFLLILAALITLGLSALIAWKEHKVTAFSLMMFACAVWSFFYVLELRSPLLADKVMWAKFQYLGIATLPTFWLLFAMRYTQHTAWLSRRNIFLLFIIPLTTIVLVWTNEFHHLLWETNKLVTVGEVRILSNSYGMGFWLHTVSAYLQLLAGSTLIISSIINFSERYRGKAIVLLIATTIPWIGNIVFLTGVIPVIDITPLVFTATGILLAWAVLRVQLLSLPIAYHVAMSGMSDGVMLVDAQQLIVEVNSAMEGFLHRSISKLLGKNANDVFAMALPLTTAQATANVEILIEDDIKRHLQLQISPIQVKHSQPSGHVIIAHDVTSQKQAENSLRYMLKQIERIKKEWEITADSLDQLICLLNEDGTVMRANFAVENWGLEDVKRVKGQRLTTLLSNVYADLAHEIETRWSDIMAALNKGLSFDFDTQDKSLGHYFEVRFEPLNQNAEDRVRGSSFAVASLYDVTKRKHLEMDLQRALDLAEKEHQKSEQLLLNILPQPIADRLKAGEGVIADHIDEVTVLFADIVGFTKLASRISASELVRHLNTIFSAFDDLAHQYGLEKIKTLGDAYMVVGGLPIPQENHAEAIAAMALDMQKVIADFAEKYDEALNIRIGMHTGSVVAGVIGTQKIAYDLWGDTVNIASRMESHGVEGSIQVSDVTYQKLHDKFQFTERGLIDVKNKGDMKTYFLTGKNDTASDAKTGETIV